MEAYNNDASNDTVSGKFIFLKDGRIFYEAAQADGPSLVSVCGTFPIFFVALKDGDNWVPESLWTEKEIEAALPALKQKQGALLDELERACEQEGYSTSAMADADAFNENIVDELEEDLPPVTTDEEGERICKENSRVYMWKKGTGSRHRPYRANRVKPDETEDPPWTCDCSCADCRNGQHCTGMRCLELPDDGDSGDEDP